MRSFFLSDNFPTLRKLRSWLVADDGISRRHLFASLFGVAVIVSLAAVFLTLAAREHSAANRRATEFAVLRLAAGAENDVAALEIAHRDYLAKGQPSDLQQFAQHRESFQRRLIELIPLLSESPARRETVRAINTDFHRWIKESTLPETSARPPPASAARPGDSALFDRLHAALSSFARTSENLLATSDSRMRVQRLIQTGGFALLSLMAIGFLAATSWMSYVAFRRHLLKSETAFAQTRSIIENTLDGVITVDLQGHIESINPAAEMMFAQTAGQVVGQNVSMLIPQRLFFHDMKNVGRGAIMAVGQRQGYFPFPIEVSLSAMDVSGTKRFVAIVRDLSERQRSEDTLRHISMGVSTVTGEEFLTSLLKQLSKALQNDFAFFVELNPRGRDESCNLTVAEKGTIRALRPYDLTNTACAETLAKGFRLQIGGARVKFPEDAILEELEIESFAVAPLVDHHGRNIGLIGVLDRKALQETNIIESTLQIFAARAAAEMERKRSEEALAAEKERLAVTLRSIADGFITIDNSGSILMINAVAERLTGWLQAEAAGRQIGEVLHLLNETQRRRCSHALQRIVEIGVAEGLIGAAFLVSRAGTERLVESNAAPIRDSSNRKVGAVIVFRDVTEKRRLEEERQKADKLESLGVVAGGIAHDFNNLLTAILGNISLTLASPVIGPSESERLNAAKVATGRAQELARQLLTFAKGGAPVKQTASIAQLIHDTVKVALQSTKAHLEFELPNDLWPVEIDPGQMSQVITNLALNADQAMPAGGVLQFSAENVDLTVESVSLGLKAGRWVKLAVQDQGVGIPEEYLKKIFDPYFTTKPKGSGLGLATAYSIIKNHHGIITVDSQPGHGSTFSICLPASDKELRENEIDGPVPMALQHTRVLVLDDEEAICMLVTCALEPLGYEVTETNDGVQAIAAYEKALKDGRRYDLVISDLTIPGGMGGQETIKRLREIDPDVLAVVSSGYANDPVMSRHEDYGFSGMIAKPYEIDALGRKVCEVLAAPRRNRVVFHEFEHRKTA